MDVAETGGGYRDVQHRHLDVAVDLGPLAVQAGFAQAVTSVERPIPTYLEEIRWQVACLPV